VRVTVVMSENMIDGYLDGLATRYRLIFQRAKTSKFAGKRAVKGRVYDDITLYEAEYAPETLQFYKLKTIPFARELRRVSSRYQADGILWK